MPIESQVVSSEIALPTLANEIVKTADVCGGKARIAGSRIRVQDIYVWHELRGQTVDEIVATFPQLTHAQVHAALAYFFSRPEEIRDQIAEDERLVDELKSKTGPGPLEEKLTKLKANASNDPISPG